MVNAVPPIKVLRASAGSGKTFSLTAHYVTLLYSENVRFQEILAVTFTNKATAEMKSRILSVIEGLAKGSAHVADFRKILMDTYPYLDEQAIKEKAHQIYRQILHYYSNFSVTTIDGFVQKVLRSFSFELGLNAAYRLEMNTEKVKKDLVARLNKLLNEREDLLQWIIDYAQKQIENDKNWNYNTVLSKLADELFKEKYQPFDEAVTRLKNNDKAILFETVKQISEETILLFEKNLEAFIIKAKEIYQRAGVTPDLLIRKSQNLLCKIPNLSVENLDQLYKFAEYVDNPEKWQKGGTTGAVAVLYQALNPLLKDLLNHLQQNSPAYYLAKAIDTNFYYLRLLKEMSVLLAEYREENGTLLISDAQTLLKGLNQGDNPAFIWEKVGNYFKYFLFDEFQDTSTNQWYNFLPLLTNVLASYDRKEEIPSHLIVGDIKQSIYRWRNGDWRILQRGIQTDLGKQNLMLDSLKENYRSLVNIIRFNNALYREAPTWLQRKINEQVAEAIGPELYTSWWEAEGFHSRILDAYDHCEQDVPLDPENKRSGGKVTVKLLPVTTALPAARAKDIKPLALRLLGEQILDWLKTGKYVAQQIGILVRNNDEAREIIEYLLSVQEALDTPQRFNVISADALFLSNNRAVRLLINTLNAMVFKTLDGAIYRANCLYLYNQLENKDPLTAEDWMDIQHNDFHTWGKSLPLALRENWTSWQQLPLAELIESLITAYGLHTHPDHIPYLLAFRDLVAEFTALGERGIKRFLKYWEEEGQRKALPATEGANAIEIITIHKSKGLAFDVVMLPFCSWELDGRINSPFWVKTNGTPYQLLDSVPVLYNSVIGKSSLYQAYFEEMLLNYMDALNLLYVATTRTRKELYISAPQSKEGKESSSLIADLLRDVLEQQEATLGTPFQDGIVFPPTEEEPLSLRPFIQDRPVLKEAASLSYWEERGNAYWSFHRYPSAGHLKKALENTRMNRELLLLGEQDPQLRHGLLLHELLAKTTDKTEFAACLKQLESDGLITFSEQESILLSAQNIFQNVALQELLNKPYEERNEQNIIDENGQLLRPDKVLFGKEETIVLDFKFTQTMSNQHIKQINRYQDILHQMGYPTVRAFLFYAFDNRLIEV